MPLFMVINFQWITNKLSHVLSILYLQSSEYLYIFTMLYLRIPLEITIHDASDCSIRPEDGGG